MKAGTCVWVCGVSRSGCVLCIVRGGCVLCIVRGGCVLCIVREGCVLCIVRGGCVLCVEKREVRYFVKRKIIVLKEVCSVCDTVHAVML